jgi:hypothetical protein
LSSFKIKASQAEASKAGKSVKSCSLDIVAKFGFVRGSPKEFK